MHPKFSISLDYRHDADVALMLPARKANLLKPVACDAVTMRFVFVMMITKLMTSSEMVMTLGL
jgi:hypothetical protein